MKTGMVSATEQKKRKTLRGEKHGVYVLTFVCLFIFLLLVCNAAHEHVYYDWGQVEVSCCVSRRIFASILSAVLLVGLLLNEYKLDDQGSRFGRWCLKIAKKNVVCSA